MSKKKHNNPISEERLSLAVAPQSVADFARTWFQALHDGFAVDIPGPMSVRDFLVEYVGLDSDYVDDRIRAIFLGGKPVDDIDAAPVSCGDELSLSGAMPGVAGITMGRNNMIAVYREGITFECGGDCDEGAGRITLHLFNFIARETAPEFLALGAGLVRRGWERCMKDAPADFFAPVVRAELDGRELSPDELAALPAPAEGAVRWVTINQA